MKISRLLLACLIAATGSAAFAAKFNLKMGHAVNTTDGQHAAAMKLAEINSKSVGTGEPVPDGEVGEVVVTVLNPDYPLVRFGTGDLSAVLAGPCPSGRTNTRIKGWMGRADQTTKIKGMFVHPSQVADIARRCGYQSASALTAALRQHTRH